MDVPVKENFFLNKAARDARCVAKDRIIAAALAELAIPEPLNFYALIMPCLHGPEVALLKKRGVPPENLYVLESDPGVLREMREYEYLRGVHLPPKALKSSLAIDYVAAEMHARKEKLDLIYLDYYGSVCHELIRVLKKAVKLKLLKPRYGLIVNQGKMHANSVIAEINSALAVGPEKIPPVRAYVVAALGKEPSEYRVHHYASGNSRGAVINYYTSIFYFE